MKTLLLERLSPLKMHFLQYFSCTNVLKISPKLRLDVPINYVLIKKKVCMRGYKYIKGFSIQISGRVRGRMSLEGEGGWGGA